jgi:hypothetical protein
MALHGIARSRAQVWCRRLVIFSLIAFVNTARADDLWQALTGGKPDLYLRYRFENVEDGQTPALKDAYASTLRTALGYSTGLYHDFGAYVQLEDVRVIGNDLYNDGGTNGVTNRAIVVDPDGTELQQANLRYRGLPKTTLTMGRQEIEHRQAPLHRYVGNILWRQNWQSFDAFRAISQSLPAVKIDYAYIWNVNRIFGQDNKIADRANYRMDSQAVDITYTGFTWGTFEPYAYLLDFDSNVPATQVMTTATYGLRFSGAYDIVTQAAKILYTGELAHQEGWRGNPVKVDENYYLGELGVTKLLSNPVIESITIKGSYEVLEGSGPATVTIGKTKTTVPIAFQTPLGTNHAFQGWADRFLITPKDGVNDLFGTFAAKVYGANLAVIYHDFSSNNIDYDYGTEWDLQLTRTFNEHYTFGLKYADYNADQNKTNLARNAPKNTATDQFKQAYDLTKFWAWVEVKF